MASRGRGKIGFTLQKSHPLSRPLYLHLKMKQLDLTNVFHFWIPRPDAWVPSDLAVFALQGPVTSWPRLVPLWAMLSTPRSIKRGRRKRMSSQQLPGTDSSSSLLPFFSLKSRAFSVILLKHTQKNNKLLSENALSF